MHVHQHLDYITTLTLSCSHAGHPNHSYSHPKHGADPGSCRAYEDLLACLRSGHHVAQHSRLCRRAARRHDLLQQALERSAGVGGAAVVVGGTGCPVAGEEASAGYESEEAATAGVGVRDRGMGRLSHVSGSGERNIYKKWLE